MDLSQIDFEKLRDEFASKVRRKHAALQDIRDVVEKKLAADARPQPDADGLLQEVPGDHRRLQPREGPGDGRGDLRAAGRAGRQPRRRAAARRRGGAERRRAGAVRPAVQGQHQQDRPRAAEAGEPGPAVVAARPARARCQDWTQNATTQAEVKVFILDNLYESLPRPPFTEAETEDIASRPPPRSALLATRGTRFSVWRSTDSSSCGRANRRSGSAAWSRQCRSCDRCWAAGSRPTDGGCW